MRQVLLEGAVAGYPLADLRVVVYDGKHHPVDSKEVAFVSAGRKAFRDAITKATPTILEPISRLAVTVPTPSVGDITGHCAAIRGRILGTDAVGIGRTRVFALVPLAELVDYAATLKSLTGGEGLYTLELDHYAAAPAGRAEGPRRRVSPASRRVARAVAASRRARLGSEPSARVQEVFC